MPSIQSIVNTSFISSLSGAQARSNVPSRTSTKPTLESQQSSLASGAAAYVKAFQGLTQLNSLASTGEDTFERLVSVVEKVIKIADRASRDPSYRTIATRSFRTLSREYREIVEDAKVGENALTELEGVREVFKAFGLDSEAAQSVAELFSGFLTYDSSAGNLADSTRRGARPIYATTTVETYTPPVTTALGTFGAETILGGSFASGVRNTVLGDFDGNGDLDIAIYGDIGTGQNYLFPLYGNGDGTFGPAVSFSGYASSSAPSFNGAVIAVNHDGDAKTDFTLAQLDWSPDRFVVAEQLTATTVSVLSLHQPSTGNFTNFNAADLDNDGDTDYVIIDNTGNFISVRNDGGTLVDVSTFATPAFPGSGSLLFDYNGDGFRDAITITAAQTTLNFYAGSSTAAFNSTPTATILPESIQNFTGGDFDNDGKNDVIVRNSTSGIARFLRGNGNGTFAAAVTIGTYTGGQAATHDYNQDGNLDLASGSGSGIQLRFGNGNGTFGVGVSWGVAAGATSAVNVQFGDFNGDGVDDAVTLYNDRVGIRIQNTSVTPGSTVIETITEDAPKELSSLFASGRRLQTLGESKLISTDARTLLKQLKRNLQAYRESREYIASNMELVRATAQGLTDVSGSLASAKDNEQIAFLLGQRIASAGSSAIRTIDTLAPLLKNARIRTEA